MKVIIVRNYDRMSDMAAEIIINAIHEKPKITIGLATGSTPLGVYERLVKDYREGTTSYEQVTTFNLDEYLGLPIYHEQSYFTFMFENLFKHININIDNVHIPSSNLRYAKQNARTYERLISKSPIDLQLLGIGNNGHIGFNEPGSSFDGKTNIFELSEDTIQANARFFKYDKELVPTKAISMGISTIMKSKQIVLIASGTNKAKAIKALIEGPITENLPASVLKNHDDFTLIIDEEAASLLDEGILNDI